MSVLRLNASALEKKKMTEDVPPKTNPDESSISQASSEVVLIRPEELPKV